MLGEDSGPEFQVLQNSLKKAKTTAQGFPLGVQLEQSLKFVERSEKRLQVLDEERAKEAVVGRSETTCGTFAFRVGSGEPSPTNSSNRLCTGIGSVESLCGGIAARTGRPSRRVVETRREAQPREKQVISRSLHWSAAWFSGQGTFVECDGDFDRQCGVVRQVKPPVQPDVNPWCRKLSARCGLRGQRVGEASHPGPATHRVRRVPDSPGTEHVELRRGTRRRRLRPLPWSWDDTDSELQWIWSDPVVDWC